MYCCTAYHDDVDERPQCQHASVSHMSADLLSLSALLGLF